MSIVKFDTWQNTDGTENYKCRAFVNFKGTGTVAIRASGNVSSITDNGTGKYTVNFTNAMSDTNYSVTSGQSRTDTFLQTYTYQVYNYTTTSVSVGDGAYDQIIMNIVVFR